MPRPFIHLGEFVFKNVEKTNGYLAGSDEERISDVEEMFERPDVDAIFCVRGGYGTPRFLRKLDYDVIRRNPKIFVGYSDLTALQMAIFQKTGLVTFSGPMVAVEFAAGIDPRTESNFWGILDGEKTAPITLSPLEEDFQIISQGKGKGSILGGCLSLVAGLPGTPFMPDLSNNILILEDIGEEPRKIDYCLARLQNAGVFDHISGLILGQFIDCKPEEGFPSATIDEILTEYFGDLPIPVISHFDYGHGGVKHTIPFGIKIKIQTSLLSVELVENAVSA